MSACNYQFNQNYTPLSQNNQNSIATTNSLNIRKQNNFHVYLNVINVMSWANRPGAIRCKRNYTPHHSVTDFRSKCVANLDTHFLTK